MAIAEFAFNNKVHIAIKSSLFQVNYGREPRIGFDIRKKEKNEKVEEFTKEIKERHEETRATLVRLQDEMKKQADRNRKRVMEKLMEKFIELYEVKKIVSENMVKLGLPASLRIYLVVNVKKIVKYREQVEGQKKIPPPPVEVAGEKEYVIEEILNR